MLWKCLIIWIFILVVNDFINCSLSQKKHFQFEQYKTSKNEPLHCIIFQKIACFLISFSYIIICSIIVFIRFHNFRMNLFAFLTSSDELLLSSLQSLLLSLSFNLIFFFNFLSVLIYLQILVATSRQMNLTISLDSFHHLVHLLMNHYSLHYKISFSQNNKKIKKK